MSDLTVTFTVSDNIQANLTVDNPLTANLTVDDPITANFYIEGVYVANGINANANGPANSVQYNNGGNLGGTSGFLFNAQTNTVSLSNTLITQTANANLINTANIQISNILNFTGSNAVFSNINNLHIPGGQANQFLQTDGNAALSWANAVTNAAGNLFEIQFNSNGDFAGSANLKFDTDTNTFTTQNIITTGNTDFSAGNTNLGSNANVRITGGTNNQVLSTNGTGNLSWRSIATDRISNGNSNVIVYGNGNVAISSNGKSNIVQVSSNGTFAQTLVQNDVTITGNLIVQGTTVTANTSSLNIQDPIIELGGGANGAPLTVNDGKDRGALLHYYTTQPVDAFMGWDNSNAEFALGSNVSVANDVVTFNTLGNLRVQNTIGNVILPANNGTAVRQITLRAPASNTFTANYTLTLPATAPQPNQVLSVDANNNLVFSGNLNSATDIDFRSNSYSAANVNVPNWDSAIRDSSQRAGTRTTGGSRIVQIAGNFAVAQSGTTNTAAVITALDQTSADNLSNARATWTTNSTVLEVSENANTGYVGVYTSGNADSITIQFSTGIPVNGNITLYTRNPATRAFVENLEVITTSNTGNALLGNVFANYFFSNGAPFLPGNNTPYISFQVTSNGNNQQFSNNSINTFNTANAIALFKDGVKLQPEVDYVKINANTIQVNRPLFANTTLEIPATSSNSILGNGYAGVEFTFTGNIGGNLKTQVYDFNFSSNYASNAEPLTVATANLGAVTVYSGTVGGGNFFAAALTDTDVAYRSTDGDNWVTITMPENIKSYSSAYDPVSGNIAALDARGNVFISNNYTTWTKVALTQPSSQPPIDSYLGDEFRRIRYVNNRLVALLSSPANYARQFIEILQSQDGGATWQPLGYTNSTQALTDIAYGNNVYIITVGAISQTSIFCYLINTSGATDVITLPVSTVWSAVDYGGTALPKFIMVGVGYVAESTDGYTWQLIDEFDVNDTYIGVSYTNNQWIITSNRAIYFSADGVNWIRKPFNNVGNRVSATPTKTIIWQYANTVLNLGTPTIGTNYAVTLPASGNYQQQQFTWQAVATGTAPQDYANSLATAIIAQRPTYTTQTFANGLARINTGLYSAANAALSTVTTSPAGNLTVATNFINSTPDTITLVDPRLTQQYQYSPLFDDTLGNVVNEVAYNQGLTNYSSWVTSEARAGGKIILQSVTLGVVSGAQLPDITITPGSNSTLAVTRKILSNGN